MTGGPATGRGPGPLRRLYRWTLELAGKRHAVWALCAVSFAESSFFPIPPDLLLIPMVLARRARAWLLAGVCSLSSVAGGLFGYAIGYLPLRCLRGAASRALGQ